MELEVVQSRCWYNISRQTRARGYKTFFMLNSSCSDKLSMKKVYNIGARGRSLMERIFYMRWWNNVATVDGVFHLLHTWQVIDDPVYHCDFVLVSPWFKVLPIKFLQHWNDTACSEVITAAKLTASPCRLLQFGNVEFCYTVPCIGVGRFRILGGPRGAKFPAGTWRRTDVDATYWRRIDVISTPCAY